MPKVTEMGSSGARPFNSKVDLFPLHQVTGLGRCGVVIERKNTPQFLVAEMDKDCSGVMSTADGISSLLEPWKC